MDLYASPRHYLFNLKTSQSAEARRLWRQSIKNKWDYKCAYCGSEHKITIDHVIPQCKGGSDFITNVVDCCESCNRSKSHHDWLEWYSQQEFLMRIEKKQSLNGLDLKQNKNFSRMGKEKTRFIENAFYCIFKGRLSLLH